MKILQISSAQSFGGGERSLVDLANELAVHSHDVHAIVRPASPLIDHLTKLPRKNLQTLPLRNALDVQSAHRLARFIREREIEIVHAHMARDYPVAAYATRRNPSARLIVTRHVLFPLSRFHRRTLSRASRVIVVSAAVERQMRTQMLVPADKLVVIPNGVDVNVLKRRQTFDRRQLCQRLNFPETCLLVGSVGELSPLKGHDDFIKAGRIVARNFPQARFIIAGEDTSREGQTQATLQRLVSELELDNHVRLLGWVDDIGSLLGTLDVFVSASRTESFGLALAEAMASGLPVVATSTEGARELIQHEETGFLVPLASVDALAESTIALLKDKERRERIGKQAAEAVRASFSLSRMVRETERIYYEVIGGR